MSDTTKIETVWVHPFERAQLGKAPFRVAGFSVQKYQACPGAPTQCGTSCDYCGTGIMNVYAIASSDGRSFKVGCDCVAKTGDRGLNTQVRAARRDYIRAQHSETRAAARAEARAATARRVEEDRAKTLAAHPGLEADLAVDHHIIRDIAARFEQFGELSDKQIALVTRLAAEARTPKIAAPTGKQTFRGKVINLKTQDNDYGYTWRMTVLVTTDAGSYLVWGTAPAALLADAGAHGGLRGCDVEITATLKRGNDAHFALMSRPRGKVLAYGPNDETVDAGDASESASDRENDDYESRCETIAARRFELAAYGRRD